MDYNFNNDNRDDFTLKREAMVDKFREKNDLETRAQESLKANKAFMKLRIRICFLFIKQLQHMIEMSKINMNSTFLHIFVLV